MYCRPSLTPAVLPTQCCACKTIGNTRRALLRLQGALFCDRMEPGALAEALPALVGMEEAFISAHPGVEVRRVAQP
jgi:hypothetical protein